MLPRNPQFIFYAIRFFSLLLLLGVFALVYSQWVAFKQAAGRFPDGSRIAGVPVAGLDRNQAGERVQETNVRPVVLSYNGSLIHLEPPAAGFQLDLERMLPSQAPASDWELFRTAFRDYLWGRPAAPVDVPLAYTFSEERLRAALVDIAARYDRPPTAAQPLPASPDFLPGTSGTALDVDAAVRLVGEALPSIYSERISGEDAENEVVILPVRTLSPARPSLENLQILIGQIVAVSGFNGLSDIYLLDLESSKAVHLAYQGDQAIPVEPDIAFTASSIMKIPIMVSAFRRMEGEPTELVNGWLVEMFANSSNEAADALMRNVIDEVRGPLVVSEDLQALDLENTFLAGYFALGSPLLQIFETPANRRSDVDTEPDLYNQAAPSEIGRLLEAIYRCAQDGNGPLLVTFQGEITQEECRRMIEYLKEDNLPYLIRAGMPEATPTARKHGYGNAYDMGDAAIVFSPGGDYILAIFLNDPQGLIFEPADRLVGILSRSVYNYFNLPGHIPAD
jgi:hypothetical protein